MGLDTSHNCWHGAYGAFNRWRKKLAEVAGYGDLDQYVGFGGDKQWPRMGVIEILLDHSDCDGKIESKDCGPLADALEALLPNLMVGDNLAVGLYTEKTMQFIEGLRTASNAGEDVEFH